MAEVTLTWIVQLEAPMAALTPVPAMVIVPDPAVAVIVGVPPQPFTSPLGVPMTAPAGSASVKVSPVLAGAPAGFVIVKVSTEFCPTPTVVGLNAFVSVGSACTVRVAFTPVVVTLCVAEMFPAFVLG